MSAMGTRTTTYEPAFDLDIAEEWAASTIYAAAFEMWVSNRPTELVVEFECSEAGSRSFRTWKQFAPVGERSWLADQTGRYHRNPYDAWQGSERFQLDLHDWADDSSEARAMFERTDRASDSWNEWLHAEYLPSL